MFLCYIIKYILTLSNILTLKKFEINNIKTFHIVIISSILIDRTNSYV